jgi:hypothetical protein
MKREKRKASRRYEDWHVGQLVVFEVVLAVVAFSLYGWGARMALDTMAESAQMDRLCDRANDLRPWAECLEWELAKIRGDHVSYWALVPVLASIALVIWGLVRAWRWSAARRAKD